MFKKTAASIFISTALLQACDSSNNGLEITDTGLNTGRTASNQPVDVFQDFIAAAKAAPGPAASAGPNLLSNAGFENGIDGWSECQHGALSASTDAYSGTGALELAAGNCFYRSIQAKPGESYALSCHIKLTTERAWTGMGMTLSDDSYNSIQQAPVAIATSGEYMQLGTVAAAGEGTSIVSMWIHSDHGAIVDDCSLTLELDQPPATPVEAENLLVNGDFSTPGQNDGAAYWGNGCGGTVVSDSTSLYMADGACVDQALSAGAIQTIDSNTATFSCLIAESEGYSDMSIFLNNELQAVKSIAPTDKNSRVEVSVDAMNAGNGFVSLYSDGHLRVEDCRLSAEAQVIDNSTDADTDTDTDTAIVDADNTPDSTADVDADTDTTPAPETEITPDPVVDNSEPDTGTDNTPEPVIDTGETSARYRLTFNAEWSADLHPINFPPPAHFSGLVGAVHNDQIKIWETGQIASPGIELMAETGGTDLLLAEIADAIATGTVASEIAGGGVPVSPGTVSIEFEVTRDHPLISVTSMIAPSPDWFVGIRDVALFDGTAFVDSLTLELPAYDSGTDSGLRFTSADLDTQPREPITRVTSDAADSDFVNGLPSLGQFVIEKLPQ